MLTNAISRSMVNEKKRVLQTLSGSEFLRPTLNGFEVGLVCGGGNIRYQDFDLVGKSSLSSFNVLSSNCKCNGPLIIPTTGSNFLVAYYDSSINLYAKFILLLVWQMDHSSI